MSQFDVLKSPWEVPLSLSIEQLKSNTEEMMGLEVSSEGFIKKITGVFSQSFNTLRLSVTTILNKDQKIIVLDENLINKLSSNKLSNNYAYLIDREVSIPAGMKSTYLEYAKHSLVMANLFANIMNLVEELRSGIGLVISTEAGLRDSTLFNEQTYIAKKVELDKQLKILGNLRKKDDYNAMAPYGDVFKNNAEFMDSIGLIRQGNKAYNSIDRRKLMLSVETTMSYIQELSDQAKRTSYSKPMVGKIGNSVAIVAEIIEAYSASVFNQEMTSKAMDSVVREISGLI